MALVLQGALSAKNSALWPYQYHFFCINLTAKLMAELQNQVAETEGGPARELTGAIAAFDLTFVSEAEALTTDCLMPCLRSLLTSIRDNLARSPDPESAVQGPADGSAASEGEFKAAAEPNETALPSSSSAR